MIGLDDAIVIATDDAVLVAAKDQVQDVKAVTDRLKAAKRPEAVIHREIYRPGPRSSRCMPATASRSSAC